MKRLALLLVPAVLLAGLVGGVVGSTFAGHTTEVRTQTVLRQVPAVSQAAGQGLSAQAIYRRDAPGVVVVTATQTQTVPNPFNPFGPPTRQQAGVLGSGFVISKTGDILTNAHVVLGGHNIRVGFASGKTYPATVVGSDPVTDVALLHVKVAAGLLHPLALGSSTGVQPGDPVVAIGNPLGQDRTITEGIVSAVARQIDSLVPGKKIYGAIQTDAAINHGNSGGPLLNGRGQVIGITSQILSPGGPQAGNIGIGFAVPINTAKQVAHQLLTTGRVQHAYLGVLGTDVTPTLAQALNLAVSHGVLVERVTPGSPAQKAGLHGGHAQATIDGQSYLLGGDILTAINGRPITNFTVLAQTINALHPGDHITLTVLRNGKTLSITATLGSQR